MRAAASRPLAPPDLTHGSRPDITGGQRQPLDLVPGEEAWHQWQEDFEPQLPGQLEIPDVEQVHAGLQQDGRTRSRAGADHEQARSSPRPNDMSTY